MHVSLYQALKSINISDDRAASVVEAVEEYLAMKISEANKGLEAQLRAQTWLLGFIGTILAIIGLGPVLAKLF